MASPRLSFLVLNYNGGSMLRESLEAIQQQTFRDFEVIVVDNNSHDDSWNIPFFDCPNWTLLRQTRNTGFSEGNNIAFARARGEIIALINNDAILAPDWAEKVINAFSDPSVGSVACCIRQKRKSEKLDSAGFDLYACITTIAWTGLHADHFKGKAHHPFGPVAAAAAYRRSCLEQCGLFHPEYFAYYEDTDLAMRLVLFGHSCYYCNEAVAWHYGSATGRLYSNFHRLHLRRNAELVYWVNMVGFSAWKHLPGHILYELMAFGGMLLRGQALVFIKAKLAAVKLIPWMHRERKRLAEALRKSVGIQRARHNLEAKLKPFLTVFAREENAGK